MQQQSFVHIFPVHTAARQHETLPKKRRFSSLNKTWGAFESINRKESVEHQTRNKFDIVKNKTYKEARTIFNV